MNMSLLNSIKRFLVGVWLAILYILCVGMVVFSLSACLFQEKLESLLKKTDNNSSPFVAHYCDSASIEDGFKPNGMIRILCLPVTSAIQQQQQHFTCVEILAKYNRWKTLVEELEKNTLKEANTRLELNDLREMSNNSKPDKGRSEEIKFLEGNLTNSEIRIKELEDIIAMGEGSYRLGDVFVEISHFERFFNPISSLLSTFIDIKNYWSFPEPILKIILVLSMGILGSLIFVTIEFIKEPSGNLKQNFNMYIFRPFLGMIIALAMYVMIKSGQSVVFGSVKSDFSPFLISFLGIISGMLSEEAYRRIASTGNQILSEGSQEKENKKEEV